MAVPPFEVGTTLPFLTNNTEDPTYYVPRQNATQYVFGECYETVGSIGAGAFGTVHHCRARISHDNYAVKVIHLEDNVARIITPRHVPTEQVRIREITKFCREVSCLQELRETEHVVTLVDVFINDRVFSIVQSLADGGDLFHALRARQGGYPEVNVRPFVKMLLDALIALHSRRIVHRDVKPQNILLTSAAGNNENNGWNLLLCGFGFARYVPEGEVRCTTRCGTKEFMAPEMYQDRLSYGTSVDMWAAGCLIFMLIAEIPPFSHDDQNELRRSIIGGAFDFNHESWANISPSLKRLIANLLQVNINLRWTAEMARNETREW
jgi:serine/threonine protein kinase